MSAEARREQREASRKLQEAANAIRDKRLRERILFSKGVMQGGSPEYARNLEGQIGNAVDDVKKRIQDAAGAVREPSERRASQALDKARDIARGLESLEERAWNSEGQRGNSGNRAQQGQQQGQRGRGEQGQGQQGQGQQGQGQEGQGQQGQGQQGQGGRGSQRSATSGGGQGAPMGGWNLTPEQIRQFSREYGQRRADAEALRRELSREGVDVSQLDQMIAQLRALESARVYDDPEELQRLQASVVERFKGFEFALRRAMEGELTDRPLLGGTSDVPAEYRKMVEEYYKALARKDAAARNP